MFSRRKIAALVAEFLGTAILAFIVLTISRSQIGIPYFVAIAAGLVVAATGVALQRDVLLNPAVTVAMWTARRIPTLKAILFIIVQLLGGLAAYTLFKYFSRGNVQNIPTNYDGRILVAEATGAFVLAFVASAMAYQRLHPLVRQVTSGAGLTLGIMVASAASAGFINPAVALANNAWAWSTYVLGPVLGAIIGVNLYGLLFAPRVTGKTAAGSTAKEDVAPGDHTSSTHHLNHDHTHEPHGDHEASSSHAHTAAASVVEDHIKEDSQAVPAGRLAKVDKAEKLAKADKAERDGKKKKLKE